MNISKFKYSFSQAKKNVFRNGLMTIASLFTIACCLLILGFFTVLSFNMNHITEQIKSQCEIQVYIKDGTSDKRIEEMYDDINSLSNIKEITYFSKTDAFDYYINQNMFPDNPELAEGLDEDTFRNSFKIKIQDISRTQETVERLLKISDVDDVVNKQDVVNVIVNFSNSVRKFTILVMILLLIIAIVIMSNTIRLTMYNRRKEINIMKYIGATDRFIKTPFIIEGIIIGFVGAAIAFAVISFGYLALSDYVSKSIDLFTLMSYASIWPFLCGLFLITGSFIGTVGSLISMRKYLNV